MIWDKIVRDRSEAKLVIPNLKHKYALVDRGQSLRGRPLRLTLGWNIMPRVGALLHRARTFEAGTLPDEYVF